MNLTDRVRANIRRLLEAKGLTYGELGFPKNYVSDVVNGVCGISTERIQEFADLLHVDVADLCASTVVAPHVSSGTPSAALRMPHPENLPLHVSLPCTYWTPDTA